MIWLGLLMVLVALALGAALLIAWRERQKDLEQCRRDVALTQHLSDLARGVARGPDGPGGRSEP